MNDACPKVGRRNTEKQNTASQQKKPKQKNAEAKGAEISRLLWEHFDGDSGVSIQRHNRRSPEY